MSLFTTARSRGVVVLAAAAMLAVSAGSGAVAGALLTGKDIKNRSIEAQDLATGSVTTNKVENGSLRLKDLDSEVTAKLGTQGPAGAKGETGARGPQGPKGESGTATYAGPHWSIIDRNVIGNGDSYLRSGPTVGTTVKPPMGVGSLGIRTGAGSDQTSFGNEVDFDGTTLASVTSVSFWEYTTGENRSQGGANATPANLASVSIELDPNKFGRVYSSLNYTVPEIPANVWTKVATDQKQWWLSGAAGNDTGCNQTTYCTLAEVKAALPDATLYTVAIAKGRDYAFSGAVDALQIGSTTYDFEPFGVIEKTS